MGVIFPLRTKRVYFHGNNFSSPSLTFVVEKRLFYRLPEIFLPTFCRGKFAVGITYWTTCMKFQAVLSSMALQVKSIIKRLFSYSERTLYFTLRVLLVPYLLLDCGVAI
uniref:Uncharacterized protein n=1 Tax=Cacopsylla melanoneura TaxID=428564 RepID=A0A8D8ZDV1_9HEMI